MRIGFSVLALAGTVLAQKAVTHRYPTILTPEPTPEGKVKIKVLCLRLGCTFHHKFQPEVRDFEGLTYCIMNHGQMKIKDAPAHCKRAGGFLPRPGRTWKNESGIELLMQYAKDTRQVMENELIAMDLDDHIHERKFIDHRGKKAKWTNWAKGYPKSHNSDDDYAAMHMRDSADWGFYICFF